MKGVTAQRSLLTGSMIFVFLLLVVFLQIRNDAYLPPFTTRYDAVHRNLLPAELLPYVDFGFTKVLADYYWVQSIQDYAAWDQEDPYFTGYLRNISALDPTFKYPYLFNIFAVPKNLSQLEPLLPILDRGMTYLPTSWEIPYYIGTEYYLFTKKETPAVDYLKRAAMIQGAPPGVYLNYASFLTKTEDMFTKSGNLLKTIYDTTDEETLKDMAALKIARDSVSQMLIKGIVAYKTAYGRYPYTVEELEQAHLVSLPKELSDLFIVTINPRTGSFRIQKR